MKFLLIVFALWFTLACSQGLASKFEIRQISESIPERGTVTRVVIQRGTTEISFIPPVDWSILVDDPGGKIVLRRAEQLAGITIHFIAEADFPFKAGIDATATAKFVTAENPNARIEDQFICYASNTQGPGVEYLASVSGKFTTRTRTAWFMKEKSFVEISLVAPDRSFAICQQAWIGLLNSFCLRTGTH